jgi:phosphatidylserine decarboxylase
VIVSAADCRLNVFHDFNQARQFWYVSISSESIFIWAKFRVKGKKFTLPGLLGSPDKAGLFGSNPSLAIFRLAPQDYHRFHSPVTGTIESITSLAGDYYTVNPQAVNENLDVFTANRRDVCIMQVAIGHGKTVPVAVVAVGALLVGSVHWAHKVGEVAPKGEDLGTLLFL